MTTQLGASGAVAAITAAKAKVNDIASSGGPKMQALAGAIVKDPIFAGEPITSVKIVRGGQTGYMAVRLPPGDVAMALPISVESDAGGFVQPGDRIDVLATHPDTSKNGGGLVTQTVLSNIKVLAVDQHTDTPKGGVTSLIGATLTLEVPASDAETLAHAKAQGNLTMALRSYADIAGGARATQGPTDTVLLFKGGAPAETVTAR